MIDNLALAVSHGLLLLVAWRFVRMRDPEDSAPPSPFARAATDEESAGA